MGGVGVEEEGGGGRRRDGRRGERYTCLHELGKLGGEVRGGSVGTYRRRYVNLLSQPDGLGIVDQDPVPGGLLNLVEKMGEGIERAGTEGGRNRGGKG